MDESSSKHRPSVRQLSKTPSWVMLGFVFGAAFVWTLRRPEPPTRTIVVTRPADPVTPAERPQLTTVEAVFTQWEQFAVWDGELTQIAMWNAGTREFSDFFEVRRVRGAYYFRSIPRLTNRIIRHGTPPPEECPLRFTETEEQYREWVAHGRFERPADAPPRAVAPAPVTVEKPTPFLEAVPTKVPAPAPDVPKR